MERRIAADPASPAGSGFAHLDDDGDEGEDSGQGPVGDAEQLPQANRFLPAGFFDVVAIGEGTPAGHHQGTGGQPESMDTNGAADRLLIMFRAS